MIPRYLREAFYPDVESGAVLPGDRLTVRWYPWLVRDVVAAIDSGDIIYVDLENWQTSQKKEARACLVFSGLLNLAGAAFSVWMWYGVWAEYSEICRLLRKYRDRMRTGKA